MIHLIHDPARLRFHAGLTQVKAACFCGVSLRSITRYENGKPPLWYLHLMRYQSGYLPGWEGFRFEPGHVWTPANELVTSGEIEHYRWMAYEFGANQRRNQDQNPPAPAKKSTLKAVS